MVDSAAELQKLRRERELYLRLLELGSVDDVEALLREALALAVEIGASNEGYLELHSEDGTPRWWLADGLTGPEVENVQRAISRGIIAEAIATGRTISTPSALLDARFSARDSVRTGRIEAVLCIPIGSAPPRGVLYLQARDRREFPDDARTSIEAFVKHLTPLADGVLARVRDRETSDVTAPLRGKLRLGGVVGRSPALAAVLEQVALVAPLNVNVLLTGESGTGKSQLARVIHDNGPRAQMPFVEVNCAAIPEHLAESELFGSLPGGHSTATRRIEGKVAAAQGGTLLLDEIGELARSAQAKLLQFLQSGEYYPLGASKPVRANVRIIAATNSDLEQAVSEHRFREDLFYRLKVLVLRAPSLIERRADIEGLVRHFTKRACEQHALPILEPSPNALRAAAACEWPGNVRELAHAVEAATIRAAGAGARQVEASHLFPEQRENSPSEPSVLTFQEATRQFQADLLRTTLEENGWNVVDAARRLDLARSHVYNLIHAFGLERNPRSAS
jgi:Nif-specific regulatory protein